MAASEVIPANDVQYSELCKVLESISKKKKHRQEQDKILATFINEFRINVAKVEGKKNSSFFPILRLLLPDKERDRPAYNLKSNTLGKQLVKILSLKETSDDAKKLLNFRSVTNSDDNDFAGVAYFVFKSRIGKNSGTLNVGKINDILDKIANAEVGNKGPIYDEAFSYALRTLNAEQMKWFLRIILKDLKLGMGTNRILAAFHPDAPELLNSCGNLSKVCEELEDGDTRPLEMGIKVFFAVSPMLSERLDVTNIMNLPDRVYQIENKFDGERFQMHIDNNTFEYFSRKGYPYSDTYGKTYDAGLLTPLLKECFSASVHSCILDGEMMGWHKQRQCFGSKGMAFDVKKITERSAFRPCYCAFDVLYYNGKSLVGPADKGGLPLYKRLEILKTMFKDVPGVIMHSKCTTVQNRTDILEALNKAIDDEEEGIVVKDTESYYIVSRRNAGWYKVKPEYTENTMEDLDLVVIGADEAENKQQGRARSFHVACADVVNTGDTPHRWVCVGKVATGLTFEEKEKVCAKLEKHWTLRKTTPPPPNLVFNKDKPDFWIKPEDSVVFQVRATELIRSTDFGTSHTLRFPRIVAVREDKPVNDVQTLNDFNKLVEEKGSVIKLSNKRISQDQIEAAEAKTRKKRVAKVIKVAEQFRTKVGEVAVTSQALAGRKLHILSDDEDCTKADLVRIIESHGGKHVENIGRDTWCCVVGRPKFRTRTLIQSQELDIITTAWLRALPSSNKPCTLSPLDMLSIKKSTKLALSKDYDRFGDSYTENIDVDTLKKIFNKMDNEPEIFLTHAEMLKLDKELYGNHNPFSFLRPCFIHFTSNDSLLEIKARMYGATVCDINSPNLTHIVKLNKDILNVNSSNVPIVSGEWLNTCFEREKLVSEHNFWIQ